MLRKGLVALVAAASALALVGCAGTAAPVIDHSVVSVGIDVPVTGAAPASADASLADLAVGAATLSGFSYVNGRGQSIPDSGFGRMQVVSEDPLVVRYTVADGLAWSDGVGIDAVDLMLDWAARSDAFPAVSFGATQDRALAGAEVVAISSDRKSLDIEFPDGSNVWRDAFRGPLPAHDIASRTFDSATPEAAKDAVVAAVEDARDGSTRALSSLAQAWGLTFELGASRPPASGPYAIVSASDELVELEANPRYDGPRSPTYETIRLRDLGSATAAVQGLSIGKLDIIQVASDEELRNVLGRISADRRLLGPDGQSQLLAGWFHRQVDGVEPGPPELGVLWNPWAWMPFVPAES